MLLGIGETDVHLFGVRSTSGIAPGSIFWELTELGRTALRLLYAVRFSLIVTLIGVLVACLVGISIGE